MKQKIGEIIKFAISMVICIFAILIPVFNIYRVEVGTASVSESGFDFATFYPEGFKALSSLGDSVDINTVTIITGIIFWLIMAVLIAYLIVLSIMLSNKDINGTSFNILNVIVLSLSCLYMVCGFFAKDIVFTKLKYVYEDVKYTVSTLALIPFIITSVLFILYYLVPFIVEKSMGKNNAGKDNQMFLTSRPMPNFAKKPENIIYNKPVEFVQEKKSESTDNFVPNQDGKIIDVLTNYKKLLDEGVLTEEEFATKKKQLLGL